MNTTKSTNSKREWLAAILLGILSMLLLPVLTHSILDHPPEYDELLHILAARSLNETGLPAIADGFYTRAQGYSQLVAWVVNYGDNELVIARLPALLFGMLATALLTIWVGIRAGLLAGVAVAVLFAISPMTLHSSVLVRFYTVHTLVVTALLLFWFEASNWRKTFVSVAAFVVISFILLGVAMHLHDLTKITILAGASGLIIVLLYDNCHSFKQFVLQRILVSCLVAIAAAITFISLIVFFDVTAILRGSVPLWSANKADNYAYYISALSVELPFVWPLFPLMATLAFFEKPRIVVFCLTVFLVALLVNSLAAQKATRYFYHAYPMICIVWAIGFQKLYLLIVFELKRQRLWSQAKSVVVVLAVISFCLVNSHEVKRVVKLVLARGELDATIPVMNEPDWSKALESLGDLPQTVDSLIVTSGVKGIYTFGGYDYEMSATVVQETDTGLDFGTDPRSNRQVIGQPESVSMVIDDPGTELFVLEDRMVNQTYSAPKESIAVLNQRCQIIDLTHTGSQLTAWLCR